MSEEPSDQIATIDPKPDWERFARDELPTLHPALQEHARRQLDALGIGYIAQEGLGLSEEPDTESAAEKQIAFTDSQGVEYSPSPHAPECYASPEIQEAVIEHFAHFNEELTGITSDLERRVHPENGERDAKKPFDPLTPELLETILKTAAEQLPSLTQSITHEEPREVQVGRIFKHTETVYENVTVLEAVQGFTANPQDRFISNALRQALVIPLHDDHPTNKGELSKSEKEIQDVLSQVLTSTERTDDDKYHGSYEKKLPLLATRLRDKGIAADKIPQLSWDDIANLLPEMADTFSNISAAVRRQESKTVLDALTSLEGRLRLLAPSNCDTIARIYYTDEQIEQLNTIGQQIVRLQQAPYHALYPEFPNITSADGYGDDFIARQQESIAEFFNGALPADTLMVHGSHFAPRVIRRGFLRPAQDMASEEFTFATDRNLGGVTGITGSRSIHWASMPNGSNYGYGPDYNQTTMKRVIAENNRIDLAKELQKGPIGAGRFAMRLGDIIKSAPYTGDPFVIPREQSPSPRYSTVEMTPRAWERLAEQLGDAKNYSDVAYVAAPGDPTSAKPYQFALPIEDMLIGIPSQDPETIPNALRKAGWSEEQIKAQTYIYTTGSTPSVQDSVFAHPKFPRSVVVPIRKDM